MKPKNIEGQGSLLVADESNHLVPNPNLQIDTPYETPKSSLNYDPAKVDPNPGLSTPLIEGWSMLHDVIKDIGAARRNQAFAELPEKSAKVGKFATRVALPREEAQELVEDSVKPKYRKAQYKLNFFAEKQRQRARNYNALASHHIVDDKVISDMVPMAASDVEHRFFYANTPAETKHREKKRRSIAKFVNRYGELR